MKFGGAALRDARGLARCAALVAAQAGGRAVVASALAGVTDRLAAASTARAAGAGPDAALVGGPLGFVRGLHEPIAAELGVAQAVGRLLDRMDAAARAEAWGPACDARLQSMGERLGVELLAAALRQRRVAAVPLDAAAAGLRAEPEAGGEAQANGLREVLVPLLAAGKVPVVTGYFAVDAAGREVLLGRGSSDYVAALLGAALGAGVIELWKEVPGVLAADPALEPGAALHPFLEYADAGAIAAAGARVIHPAAVATAQRAGIPIHVRHVRDPGGHGTRIGLRVPA